MASEWLTLLARCIERLRTWSCAVAACYNCDYKLSV